MTLIQDIVKFNGPTKSQLGLKISKEKYFMPLTLYYFILQIDKKLVIFLIFLEHPKSHTHNKYRLSCQHTHYE